MEEEDLLRRRKAELIAIKEIDPELILRDLDIPYKKRTGYYECRAVWRGDRHPSMSVFQDGDVWRWRDHGASTGGTWIDLYMIARNMTYQEAVKYLRERFLNGADIKLSSDDNDNEEATLRENVEWKTIELKDRPAGTETKAYLAIYRKIRHVPEWLRDVDYTLQNIKTGEVKHHRGFGVVDARGNWHVRYTYEAKVKERVIRQNDEEGSTYSLIMKREHNDACCIVEGFIDGIRVDEILPELDIIILNGVENWRKIVDVVKQYRKTYLCLDNDEPGRDAERELLPHVKNPIRICFEAKDIDEAIRNKEQITFKKLSSGKTMRLDR